jgi:hypothetical protein
MSLIFFAKEERHLMGKVQTSLEEEIFLRVMHTGLYIQSKIIVPFLYGSP